MTVAPGATVSAMNCRSVSDADHPAHVDHPIAVDHLAVTAAATRAFLAAGLPTYCDTYLVPAGVATRRRRFR